MSNLSFDEFRAIQERDRSLAASKQAKINRAKGGKRNQSKEDQAKANPPSKDEIEVKPAGYFLLLGDFLEMHETQFLCISLLLLDTFLSYLRLVLVTASAAEAAAASDNIDVLETGGSYRFTVDLLITLIKSFVTFSHLYFAAEIVTIFLSFGSSMIGHIGYTLDIVVIGFQLYYDYSGNDFSHISSVLNVFRLWRLYRLFNTIVDIERLAHDKTKGELAGSEGKLTKVKNQLKGLEEELVKEQEARKSVEDMLQGYKEEVDTLNEALKIAARDIAEIGEDEDVFLSEDEDGDEMMMDGDGDGDEGTIGGGASVRTGLSSVKSSNTAAESVKSAITFMIHSDGTFEKR